jgi:MFS family permease
VSHATRTGERTHRHRADTTRTAHQSPVRELLARPDFRRMLIGQTVSALGDWMGTIALMMLVLRLSGSSAAVGGVLVLQLLPSAVAAPLVGRLVARVDRRQVMLVSDAIRAVVVMLVPLVSLVGWVYVWAFLLQVAGLAFLPARDAATPILAGVGPGDHTKENESRLSAANALLLATYYGSIPFGAGLFALIVTMGDAVGLPVTLQFVVAFSVDALTYLVSYAAIRRIGDLGHRTHEVPPPIAGADLPSPPSAEAGEEPGRLRDVLRYPVARAVVQATLVAALGLGALFSLGAVFVTGTVGAGPVGFGSLVAMFGVGAASGLGATRLLANRVRAAQLRVAVVLQGAMIVSMILVAILPLTLVGAAVFGAAVTVALINAIGLLQDSLAGGKRDLALSAFHLSLRGGLALSALLAGGAADLLNPLRIPLFGVLRPEQIVLLAAGSIVVLSALVIRPHGAVDASGDSPRPELRGTA